MRESPVVHEGRVVGVHKDYGRCQHRYQESPLAGAPPLCSCGCGLYAVGACSTCLKPLAGIHVGKTLPLLCADCQAEVEAVRLADAQAEHRRQEEVLAARLMTIADPFERVLVAVHGCPSGPGREYNIQPSFNLNQAALQACPQISPETGDRNVSFFRDATTLGDFADWARQRFSKAGLPANKDNARTMYRTTIFGRRIPDGSTTTPSWVLGGASTEYSYSGEYESQIWQPFEISGGAVGPYFLVSAGGTYYHRDLSVVGAWLIAEVLGLGHPSDPPGYSLSSLRGQVRKSFGLNQ